MPALEDFITAGHYSSPTTHLHMSICRIWHNNHNNKAKHHSGIWHCEFRFGFVSWIVFHYEVYYLGFWSLSLVYKRKNTLQPLKTGNIESHLLQEYDNNSNQLGVGEDSPSGPKSPQFNWGQRQQLFALASSFCYCWTKRLAVKTRCCSRGIRGGERR